MPLSISKKLFLFILLFVYIFGFYTKYVMASQLATLFIIFLGFFDLYINKLIISKYLLLILFFLLLDLSISIVNPIFLGTYDFSILSTKINFIACVVASYFISVYFYKNHSKETLFLFLVLIFIIQSIIVCIMLSNQDLAETINFYTKNEATIERFSDSYGGARGLGITESAAFGFSITMGLLFLISTYSYLKKFINIDLYFLVLLFGVISSISAGRTALYGLLFSWLFIFIFILKNKLRMALPFFIFNLIAIFIFYFLIQLNSYNFKNPAIQNLYSYSMEPILNFIQYGSLETSSTNSLQNMYFPLTEKQFLVGDGHYMDGERYYLNTDAGYMRFSLFYGVIWSIFFYLSFLLIFLIAFINIKNFEDKLLLLLCVVGAFFLHYKGEVVLFSIPFNKILFLILFYFWIEFYGKKIKEL